MPQNEGHPPDVERVDLRFRSGWITRNVDPRKYRWAPWPDGKPDPFDIETWQEAKG